MALAELFIVAALLAAGAHTPAAPTVVSVEWLPLAAHRAVFQEYAKAGGPEIIRNNAMGDEQQLLAVLRDASSNPEAIVIAVGPLVYQKAAEVCPKALQIVLFASVARADNVIAVHADPAPRQILEAAARLRPGLKRLAVIYTTGFAPNVHLAGQLQKAANTGAVALIHVCVPHGLCRTDSDFEKALNEMKAGGGCGVLYLPDDPNVSRFVAVVSAFADKNGIFTLGTDAARGKGCSAAFVRDNERIGRNLAAVVRSLVESRQPDPALLNVPPALVFEERAAAPVASGVE